MEGKVAILPRPQHAAATLPSQPPAKPSLARALGAGVLGVSLAALGGLALYRAVERTRRRPPSAAHLRAARRLGSTASILSLSVLADSGMEHYRGAFHNPAMYVAPLVGAATLANSLHIAARPSRLGRAGASLCAFAFVIGSAGTGYHIYNVAKREGGIDWLNLFYGAPVGAPFALSLAGLAGLAASELVAQDKAEPRLLQCPAGVVLALGAAGGLLGTVAEAALMHFRGTYHDPFMYLPVSLPPLSAVLLCLSIRVPQARMPARRLLQATQLMGLIGLGFHLYGISRNMGGFYNWSQNLLNGPPLPAPPSFTGIATAGLAALELMEQR